MASLKAKVFMVGLMVVCMAMEWQRGEAVVASCGPVSSSLGPCINYARGKVPTVPGACCNGVKSLNTQANTPQSRQLVCACLKKLATSIPGINMGTVSGIPGKCGVSVGYPISTSVDCTKVH